jgi:hypothetical protein
LTRRDTLTVAIQPSSGGFQLKINLIIINAEKRGRGRFTCGEGVFSSLKSRG